MRRFVREMLPGSVELVTDRVIKKKLLGKFSPVFASVEQGISSQMGRECHLIPIFSREGQQVKQPVDEERDGREAEAACAGDLIFFNSSSAGYYLIHAGRGVEIGWFGDDSSRASFEQFRSIIEGALPPGVSAQWRPLSEVHKSFSVLSAEWGACSLGEMEQKAGKLLGRNEDRDFLRRLSAMGRTLVEAVLEGSGFDAASGAGVPAVLDETRLARAVKLQEFESLGAIKREYVIFCQQTKNQISMVESLGAIEEASRRGFKCFYCGRSFSEERIDQLVSLTPFGMRIIAPHFWIAVKFYEAALNSMPVSQILWTDDKVSDTIDFLISVDGGLALVVIKEGTIFLDDAYRINVKGDLYQPDLISVLTTKQSSREVRQYLTGRDKPIIWMTDPEKPANFVKTLLELTRKERFRSVLAEFVPMTGCDVTELIMNWYFPKTIIPKEQEMQEVKETLPLLVPSLQVEEPSIPEPKIETVSAKKSAKSVTPPAQELIEEIPKEVVVGEPWGAVSVKETAEDLTEVVAQTAEELQSKGILGRESVIQILLTEVKKASGGKSDGLLFSTDGFTAATTFKDDEGELLAPYCLEVANLFFSPDIASIKNSSVIIGSKKKQVHIYPCGPFLLGVFFPYNVKLSSKKTPDLSHIPIEMHLSAVVADLLSPQVFTAVLATQEGDMVSTVGPARETMALAELSAEIVPKLVKWGEIILGDKLWFIEWEINMDERVAMVLLKETNLVLKLNRSVSLFGIQEKFEVLESTFS